MADQEDKRVVLGRVSGLFGVRGWVKVFSGTDPREGIIDYSPWQLRSRDEWREVKVEAGQRHGNNVVVKLAGVEDRDAAAALLDTEIAVWRSQLPRTRDDEVYWADLEGLVVRTESGMDLGIVDHLLATGANDVLVVKGERERLVPFIRGQVVKKIDLDQQLLVVDWDPEF